MDVGEVIRKVRNENEPRDLYDVAVHLCLDEIPLQRLANAAREAGVVNQVGALVDIAITYLLPPDSKKYRLLERLSAQLHGIRKEAAQPFYKGEDSDLSEKVARHMARLNSHEMNELLKKWGLIIVLSPEKFKQVYIQENEDRQAETGRYSFVDK